jgi:transposase
MTNSTKKRDKHPLKLIHPHAAGIDVGSRDHFVAIDSEDPDKVRSFGCTTVDIIAMGNFLKEAKVTTVAMESTGVYWVPIARILEEDFGLEVLLVDPRYVRSVPGKKTDVKDCQWLQRLHSYGLLTGAFRVATEIEPIKVYYRHRKNLVECCAQHIQRMQKALEVMNVQLHKVLSDVVGVSGMRIIRAIIGGERNPAVLAGMCHASVRSSKEDVVKALGGNFVEEQLFALGQSMAAHDFFQTQLATCDQQIDQAMKLLATRELPKAEGDAKMDEAKAPKSTHRRKNQSYVNLAGELARVSGVDLTKIPGVQALTAQAIISEIGVDVSAFPTEQHFVSWLSLCPNHVITGGRVRKRRTRPNACRLATAFRIAAQTLHKSKTALGAFYRRLRTRIGAPKAITAAARKMATIVYRMLKFGEAFVEKGQEAYEAKYKERQLGNLQKSAKALGFSLVQESVS